MALDLKPAGLPDKLYVYCLKPVARNAATVGTLFEPDLEKLAALDPDLIIVASRSTPKYVGVSQVAPAHRHDHGRREAGGDVSARLGAYGTLFGKDAEAKALADKT